MEETIEAPPQLPTGDRGYFACRTCRRILSEPQWFTQGCTECNTGPIRRGELMELATPHFINFIGLVAPEKSWVARLIGKTHSPNGVYAEALTDEDEDDYDNGNEDDEEDVDNDNGDDLDKYDENENNASNNVNGNNTNNIRPNNRPLTQMTDEELLNLEREEECRRYHQPKNL